MAVDRIASWLGALEQRHLSDLTPSELARALRALSSCYVERRGKLAQGAALETAGKRAAFALFYAPLHLFVVQEVVSMLPDDARRVRRIVDLGCGTGTAGAAWSMVSADAPVTGFDRNRWAIVEAEWTYATLGTLGRAKQRDIDRVVLDGAPGLGILVAFTVNELAETVRAHLLARLLAAQSVGARVLIVEPIARRMSAWWDTWANAFVERNGRADEWRFPIVLPERQRGLARAAGLDPRALTARSLWM